MPGAEQDLGTTVGCLAHGVRNGIVAEDTERISWRGRDGVGPTAGIPRINFIGGADRSPGAAGESKGLAHAGNTDDGLANDAVEATAASASPR